MSSNLMISSLPDNIGNPNCERLPVRRQAKQEYVQEMVSRYRSDGRKEQTRLLDEMVRVCRMNRKYLIRVLHRKRLRLVGGAGPAREAGRPRAYDAPEISVETKAALTDRRASLNPFTLHAVVQRKRKAILRLCSLCPTIPISTVLPPKDINRQANHQRHRTQQQASLNLHRT